MMEKYSEKGSKWRKWDFHVHTPASVVGSSFTSWDEYIDHLIDALNEHEVKAIVTADYFTVEGYRKLLDYYDAENRVLKHGSKQASVFLVPGIELRLNIFNSDNESINIHVLFDPEKCSPDFIQEQFIEELSVNYRGQKYKLKESHVLGIGKSVKTGQAMDVSENYEACSEADKKTYKKACYETVTLSQSHIIGALDAIHGIFCAQSYKDRVYLIAIAGKGHGGLAGLKWFEDNKQYSRAGLLREDMTAEANLILSNNADDREFYLGKHPKCREEEFKTRFINQKPCVWGSDKHSNDNLLVPNGIDTAFTWIKTDLVFSGLKQVLIEPEDRVYIGPEPPKLKKVRANKTKYIAEIQIGKVENSSLPDKWFEQITTSKKIKLNHDLVAIIGNKGSGKSALADVIALLGSSGEYDLYSFLVDKKFRSNRGKYAKHFESSLYWLSGDSNAITLEKNPADDEPRKIKYIPQRFFEFKCNEDDEEFEKEVKAAIFSYIAEKDRYGKADLDELMEFITEPVDSKIEIVRSAIQKLNAQICSIESQTTNKNISYLKKLIEEKKKELKSHEAGKPETVEKPGESNDDDAAKKITEEMEREKEKHQKLKEEKVAVETQISGKKEKLVSINRVNDELSNLDQRVNSFIEDYADDLLKLELDASNVIKMAIDRTPLNEKRVRYQSEIKKHEEELGDGGEPGGLIGRIEDCEKLIFELEAKLSAPMQKYIAYQQALEEWNKEKAAILGDSSKDGTLKYYESELSKITEELPSVAGGLRGERLNKTSELYDALNEKLAKYKSLFEPIEKALKNYESVLKDNLPQLAFSASIRETKIDGQRLKDWFFEYVAQNRKGTFHENGFLTFLNYLREYDLSEKEQCLQFLNGLIDRLEYEYVNEQRSGEAKNLSEAIKNSMREKIVEFYNGLFCLEFIDPTFSLKLGDKSLSKLSPGEKGSILLVFYLLLDQEDIPLIIDQPEENLDNQSIYETLVPIIKLAKTKRQVIMVTHNPNLAVVCDAEQIIRANIDKGDMNKVTYISGAIENPNMNIHVVDVLEGTFPAFSNREKKYIETKPKKE